jgi:putative endonuclease
MYYAYVLKSLRDSSFYYGSSEDLEKRLAEHNAGKVRYTKGHAPYGLHYSESFQTRKEAAAREKFWKTITGYRWLRKANIIVG